MVARPRFDFVGSLELCRKLRTLAHDIDKGASTRKTGRDIAVAEGSFQGPYGDDHRARATSEDVLVEAIVDVLDGGAKAWATAWRTAANDMNDYAYYLAQQQRDSMSPPRNSSYQAPAMSSTASTHIDCTAKTVRTIL